MGISRSISWELKMGRPPIGKQAMTALERQQRRRAKLAKQAARQKELLARREAEALRAPSAALIRG
jgi:hypothetical protein